MQKWPLRVVGRTTTLSLELASEKQQNWGEVTLEQLHCNCCLTFFPLRRGSPAQRKETGLSVSTAVSGPIRPIELDEEIPRVGVCKNVCKAHLLSPYGAGCILPRNDREWKERSCIIDVTTLFALFFVLLFLNRLYNLQNPPASSQRHHAPQAPHPA